MMSRVGKWKERDEGKRDGSGGKVTKRGKKKNKTIGHTANVKAEGRISNVERPKRIAGTQQRKKERHTRKHGNNERNKHRKKERPQRAIAKAE